MSTKYEVMSRNSRVPDSPPSDSITRLIQHYPGRWSGVEQLIVIPSKADRLVFGDILFMSFFRKAFEVFRHDIIFECTLGSGLHKREQRLAAPLADDFKTNWRRTDKVDLNDIREALMYASERIRILDFFGCDSVALVPIRRPLERFEVNLQAVMTYLYNQRIEDESGDQ